MKIHKSAGILIASLAFVAGCQGGVGSPSPSGSATSRPARTPAQELNDAVTKLGTITHKYTVKAADTTFLGSVDPAAKALTIELTATDGSPQITANLVRIGTDIYAMVNGLSLPGFDATKWYHLDIGRVKSLAVFGIGDVTDPVGLLILGSGVKAVEKTGDRTYKGTFTLTKPTSGLTPQNLRELGDKAKDIPFEATLDAEGRLVSVTFTVPAFGTQAALPVDTRISEYGAKFGIDKPAAAQVIEAPEFVYTLLNSM